MLQRQEQLTGKKQLLLPAFCNSFFPTFPYNLSCQLVRNAKASNSLAKLLYKLEQTDLVKSFDLAESGNDNGKFTGVVFRWAGFPFGVILHNGVQGITPGSKLVWTNVKSEQFTLEPFDQFAKQLGWSYGGDE